MPVLVGSDLRADRGLGSRTVNGGRRIIVTAVSVHFVVKNRKLRALQIVDINSMSGPQFEQYVQKLLADRGYRVSRTVASGDLGIDLVASRTQERIAIQVKRYTGRVSRRAISDAVAGMQHYRRLLEPIDNVPPAEAEAAYYAALDQIDQAA